MRQYIKIIIHFLRLGPSARLMRSLGYRVFDASVTIAVRSLQRIGVLTPVKQFDHLRVKKILIIRTDRVGDLILSIPALRVLRNKFGQAEITMLLNRGTRDLAKVIPWIDKIMVYRNLIQTTRMLKQEGFDLAIDLIMDYQLKSALLAILSGAPHRLGFDIEGRGGFFNIRVKPDRKEKHMIEHTLDVVRAIGVDTTDKNPEIAVSDDKKRYIEEFLNQQNVFGSDLLVGIHPGGYYPSQRWLPDRFAQLADDIIVRYGAGIILIEGPGEEKSVRKVASLMSRKAIGVVGISLSKLPALIARCNLIVCNNSGPLHIATAVGTPTVSTMGPTVPYLWWPKGENHIVFRKDLPCSPCNLGVCKSHKCMKLITVEDVMGAVSVQLGKIKKR